MKPILTILAALFPLFLMGQVPDGKEMNITQPPNLSWVSGKFEVLSVNGGTAFLRPLQCPSLPDKIEVKVSPKVSAGGLLKPKSVLWVTIRNGLVIKAKRNE